MEKCCDLASIEQEIKSVKKRPRKPKDTDAIIKTYEFRLLLKKKQEKALNLVLFYLCNFYNDNLRERVEFLKRKKEAKVNKSIFSEKMTFESQCKNITNLKDKHSIHTHLYQDSLKRLYLAFQSYFKRIEDKNGKAGFPRYKTLAQYNSFTFQDACRNRGIRLVADKPGTCFKTKRINMTGVGDLKYIQHQQMEGNLKTIGLTKDVDGKWYVSFVREIKKNILPETGNSIGIDAGLKTYLTFSNGDVVKTPDIYQESTLNIKRAQKIVSRRQKREKDKEGKIVKEESNGRKKAKLLLGKAHVKERNIRNDFTHKESRKIVNNYDNIAIEALNIKKMVQTKGFGKPIHRAAWGQLFEKLSYKAIDAGRKIARVDPSYTSQDCFQCRNRVKKELSDRTHSCHICGYTVDRDLNAARNILRKGFPEICEELFQTIPNNIQNKEPLFNLENSARAEAVMEGQSMDGLYTREAQIK